MVKHERTAQAMAAYKLPTVALGKREAVSEISETVSDRQLTRSGDRI
jgi:hypothetical protein